MNKVLFFNPRSARFKPRIPNSILSVASAIDGLFDYAIVDGNLESDPEPKIIEYLRGGEFGYFGCSCMPGPQLKQAIPICQKIKAEFPGVVIIWGGYFPSNQPAAVLDSGFVDYVINGPGEKCLPSLLQALEHKQAVDSIHNLIFKSAAGIVRTPKDDLYDQDSLPPLPYERLNQFYPIDR